jgi:hypothetical protein
VRSLTWGLKEVLQYAEVLLNKDDVDAKGRRAHRLRSRSA